MGGINWLTTPWLLAALVMAGAIALTLALAVIAVRSARRSGGAGSVVTSVVAVTACAVLVALAATVVRAFSDPTPSNRTLANAMAVHPQFRAHLDPASPPNGFPAMRTTAAPGVWPGTVTFTTSTTPRRTGDVAYHPSFIAEVDKETGELVKAQRMFSMASMFQPESGDRYSYNVVDRNGRNGAGFHVTHFVTDDRLQVLERFDLEDLENGDADLHDFELLDNGNALLLAYRRRRADLRDYGGAGSAIVYDPVIAERTPRGETVWEWDGAGQLDLDDVPPANQRAKLTARPPSVADYAHPNSLEVFPDGDILLSLRNYDCIYRIDRETGEIVWTFGGQQCTDNQFDILDDPLDGFSHQHDATLVQPTIAEPGAAAEETDDGGGTYNVLLFDNGNLHQPQRSRAVEYEIDEENATARLVWSYSDGRYTGIFGSAERLPNGNTLIGWGALHDRVITEVTAGGREVFTLSLPPGQRVYRAYQGAAD